MTSIVCVGLTKAPIGKTESVVGESFGVVENRKIIIPEEYEGFDFKTGGYEQPILDIKRLDNTLKFLSEKVGQNYNPKNELSNLVRGFSFDKKWIRTNKHFKKKINYGSKRI